MLSFDALVVGGGIAGSATATALAREGLRPLLCEAGLPNDKRLAGELMHPPCAERLEELGLLDALREAGGVETRGFAIFRGPGDAGTRLSYSEVPGCRPTGLALDHTRMTRSLLEAAARQPGVTAWLGARVLDVRFEAERPVATILRDGERVQVRVRLVVSAEGRSSKIRAQAGIQTEKTEAFRMVGFKVPGGRLPYPGFGHVFLGGRTATLAYQMGERDVRIMFENEADEGKRVPEDRLAALPEPFRSDVRRAMQTEPLQSATVYGMMPSRFAMGELALVGDAGGCVHPVTASGISYCVSDAVELAQQLSRSVDPSARSIHEALRRYEAARMGPMRTRAALGPALVDAFNGQTPEMQLLRFGLFRYWARDPRGRRRSMGLLSTHDQRMRTMITEYAAVAVQAALGATRGIVKPSEVPHALAGLVRWTAGYAVAELRAQARPV